MGPRLARPAACPPSSRSGSPSSAASAWSRSRSSSCASGTSRCSRATSTWPRRRTTRCASSPSRRRAARSSTATGEVLVDNRTALELQVKRDRPAAQPERRRRGCSTASASSRAAPDADPQQDPRRGEGVRGVPGDAAPRRRLRHRLLPAREPAALPRRLGRARLRAPLPAGDLAAHLLGYAGEVDSTQLDDPRYEALAARRPGRQGRGRVRLRQPAARNQRRDPGPGRRRRPAHRRPALRARAADRQRPRADDRRRGPARRRAGDRLDRPARAASSR